MTDKEIFDIVDKAIQRYADSTNTFLSAELDSVRHEVKGVKDEFRQMNGRLRDVCEWKATHEGIEKVRDKGIGRHLAVATVLIMFIGVIITGILGFKKVNNEMNRIKNDTELQMQFWLEQRGFGKIDASRGGDSLIIQ